MDRMYTYQAVVTHTLMYVHTQCVCITHPLSIWEIPSVALKFSWSCSLDDTKVVLECPLSNSLKQDFPSHLGEGDEACWWLIVGGLKQSSLLGGWEISRLPLPKYKQHNFVLLHIDSSWKPCIFYFVALHNSEQQRSSNVVLTLYLNKIF